MAGAPLALKGILAVSGALLALGAWGLWTEHREEPVLTGFTGTVVALDTVQRFGRTAYRAEARDGDATRWLELPEPVYTACRVGAPVRREALSLTVTCGERSGSSRRVLLPLVLYLVVGLLGAAGVRRGLRMWARGR